LNSWETTSFSRKILYQGIS